MRDQPDHLDDYPLFYEEIGRSPQGQALEQSKQDCAYERDSSLSEDQIVKLGDDLKRPMKDLSPPPQEQ